MSLYYKPIRKPDWNYGGPKFRLSRSKIALFLECPQCFYIDNKLGTARPPGFPFNLNSAVDALLKKEFDGHRAAKSAHPLMTQYGVNAVPFAHKDMDLWRENFKGIEYFHEETGLMVCGAVDDIWVNLNNELIVVDYKSTSKDKRIESLDEEWHDGYKRQMEIYQWLLRKRGFDVSDTGYFVYANATKDRKAFDAKLDFDITLIPYTGKTAWVDDTLARLKRCLDGGEVPAASADCDYCRYRETVESVLRTAKSAPSKPIPSTPPHKKLAKTKNEETTGQLF